MIDTRYCTNTLGSRSPDHLGCRILAVILSEDSKRTVPCVAQNDSRKAGAAVNRSINAERICCLKRQHSDATGRVFFSIRLPSDGQSW